RGPARGGPGAAAGGAPGGVPRAGLPGRRGERLARRGRRHQRRAAGAGHLPAGCYAAARGRRWPVSTNSSAAVPGGVAARDRGQKARRPGTPRVRTDGVSAEARRQAAALLEVLAGVRTPTEVAAQLAISLTRYYIIESRALQGLLAACEPR